MARSGDVATSLCVWTDELRSRFDELLDEHRSALRASVEGLTE